MERSDLIDLDTYVALVKASPKATVVPFSAAKMVVLGLDQYAFYNAGHVDADGKVYWIASLKQIADAGKLGQDSMNQVGKTCRLLGLTCWRMTDGYHVAYSDAQLTILKNKFKAEARG